MVTMNARRTWRVRISIFADIHERRERPTRALRLSAWRDVTTGAARRRIEPARSADDGKLRSHRRVSNPASQVI